MRGTMARSVRRDLRRAVGNEAVTLIDAHTQAIDNQILPNLNALHTRAEDASATITRERISRELQHAIMSARLEKLEAWQGATFWNRFLWFVAGR